MKSQVPRCRIFLRSKYRFLLILAFLLSLVSVSFVKTDSVADFPLDFVQRVDPGGRFHRSFELDGGMALYARFHITYGPGIYFFIVDQDGHDDIMAGTPASTVYREDTYSADDGQWYYVEFQVPHQSTWHVWWSKYSGAPSSDQAATIEGHVRIDIEGPEIIEFGANKMNLSGSTEIKFDLIDRGYPISRIGVFANDTQLLSIDEPDYDHYITGFRVSGSIAWDTAKWEDGTYVLRIVAWDSLGHRSESIQTVYVKNGPISKFVAMLLSYLPILITIAAAFVICCICFSRGK